jgi:hypothetical protein
MLDFNSTSTFPERFEALIDAGLQAREQQQARRQYLGASRLGVSCERQLQYEYAQAPVDPDKGSSGRILRIFERGHRMEDAMVGWLRAAGFVLKTEGKDGQQFGFSVAGGRIKGHVDGIITAAPPELGLSFPMLFECKTMADKHWKACAKSGVAVTKPVYAAQMATYQAYMEGTVEGISRNPALFTAINKDTQELWFELVPFDAALAQKMSDRAVRVIQATEAGELLPRAFAEASHFECKFCSYAQRCWGGV